MYQDTGSEEAYENLMVLRESITELGKRWQSAGTLTP